MFEYANEFGWEQCERYGFFKLIYYYKGSTTIRYGLKIVRIDFHFDSRTLKSSVK